MQVAVGTYTGDGNDSRGITGVGFQPDLVIVKCTNASRHPVWRSSAMAGDSSAYLASATANVSDRIESLDGDGFTVGTANEVNADGSTYHWWAFRDDGQGDFAVGSYIGNSTDDRSITGVGFQPDVVVVKGDRTAAAWWRPSSLAGDLSLSFAAQGAYANLIQALEADGFQVGTQVEVNYSGTSYYWFAFKAVAGICQLGSYTGDSSDNRSLEGLGFQPDLVWLKRQDAGNSRARPRTLAGDSTTYLLAGTTSANVIQALESDGFQVGSDPDANNNAKTYHWVAWREGYSGQPVQKQSTDSLAFAESVSDRTLGSADALALTDLALLTIPKSDSDAVAFADSVAGIVLTLQDGDAIAFGEAAVLDQGRLRSSLELQAIVVNKLRSRLLMGCDVFPDRVKAQLEMQCTISPRVQSRLLLETTVINQSQEAAAAAAVIAPAMEVTFL